MYELGIGVPKDRTKAAELCVKSAEGNDSDAQIHLSVMYYSGDGVPQDMTRTYYWACRALLAGNKKADNLKKRAEERLEAETVGVLASQAQEDHRLAQVQTR